jgi:hypothetical protein
VVPRIEDIRRCRSASRLWCRSSTSSSRMAG